MSFLKAEWRKLAIANYVVDPFILQQYLPANTELDLWNGKCYVSLVGFMFTKVRLMGIPIPFHRHFEEVNLRFYVRHLHKGEWKRGVVFIKELVPKSAITFVANTIYGEHYETVKMSHQWNITDAQIEVKYAWYYHKKLNLFEVRANPSPQNLITGSETEFITEHYWGYTKHTDLKTTEYEVWHPKWQIYQVMDYVIDVNFKNTYGSEFEFLNSQQPDSVMLAEGSEIRVENKRTL